MPRDRIYSIGHSSRTLEELVGRVGELADRYELEIVLVLGFRNGWCVLGYRINGCPLHCFGCFLIFCFGFIYRSCGLRLGRYDANTRFFGPHQKDARHDNDCLP